MAGRISGGTLGASVNERPDFIDRYALAREIAPLGLILLIHNLRRIVGGYGNNAFS